MRSESELVVLFKRSADRSAKRTVDCLQASLTKQSRVFKQQQCAQLPKAALSSGAYLAAAYQEEKEAKKLCGQASTVLRSFLLGSSLLGRAC